MIERARWGPGTVLNGLMDALDGRFVKPEALALDTCVLGSETWEGGAAGNRCWIQAARLASGGKFRRGLVAGSAGGLVPILSVVVSYVVVARKKEFFALRSCCGVYCCTLIRFDATCHINLDLTKYGSSTAYLDHSYTPLDLELHHLHDLFGLV